MGYAKLYSNQTNFKDLRKGLRQNQTKAEELLWAGLRKNRTGYRFRRQFQIKEYIVDFCCCELRLAIEVDGFVHEDDEVYKKDLKREKDLEKLGYKIVRYNNQWVYKDIQSIWWGIVEECKKRAEELKRK